MGHLSRLWTPHVATDHTWRTPAAAAAKSLQSCPTLCDPMDCSLPGSSVHGIFQARILEWVAIAFSRRTLQWVIISWATTLRKISGYKVIIARVWKRLSSMSHHGLALHLGQLHYWTQQLPSHRVINRGVLGVSRCWGVCARGHRKLAYPVPVLLVTDALTTLQIHNQLLCFPIRPIRQFNVYYA